jgi:NAD+ diphosphatase
LIHELEPRKFYNQFKKANIGKDDYILSFRDRNIYAKSGDGDLDFLTYDEFQKQQKTKEAKHFIYLFSIEENDGSLRKYFLLSDDNDLSVEGYEYRKMYDVRRCTPKHQVMAAATAWHLYVWYRDNRFCGRCGSETIEDDKERMLRCPKCGNMIFPKIAPAVIVGVTDGDKILLTKYANREYKRYALIAGFNEIGEDIEETVRREVMEEVGLSVKNIRYYKSQPWGFDSNLLLGFFCEAAKNQPITMDEGELSVAEWVKREDIPDYGEYLSLTHEMMMVFKAGSVLPFKTLPDCKKWSF